MKKRTVNYSFHLQIGDKGILQGIFLEKTPLGLERP